jgi:hypothetical protein
MRVPVQLRGVETDGNFASVFSVRTVAGSWEQASNLPNSIVLSESKARHLFGSVENALGRTFGSMNNHQTIYTVRAVMADLPKNISFFEYGIEALKLNDEDSPRHKTYGYNYIAYVFGLMPDGVEYEDVSRELTNTILPGITHIQGRERTDETLVATRMGESTANNMSIVVGVITTFAILILSVGLLNFLHFLIGSILNRSREYSLRRLFGCRMRDLFGLLFTQTFMLLCATAFVCSYATRALIPLIEVPDMFVDFLFIDTSLMWWQTAEYIGWLLLVCMVICVGVCFYIRRTTIQQGVTGISSAPRIRRHLGRNLMMGLQFFICWVFVSLTVGFYLQARLTTGTVLSSLSRAEKEQILSIPLDGSKTLMRPDEKQVLANRLKSHAGVKDMMFCDGEIDAMYFNPLFLVKDFDAQGEPKKDDTFMTNADTPSLLMEGLIDNPVNPFTGNPVNTEPKKETQYVINYDHWRVTENTGNTYHDDPWYSVHDNIFQAENWAISSDPSK